MLVYPSLRRGLALMAATAAGLTLLVAPLGQPAMALDGSIAGSASSLDGPLDRASVSVYRVYTDHIVSWRSTRTDVDGSYSVEGLAAGTYRVCFEPLEDLERRCWEDAASVVSATDISVGDSEAVAGIDVVLGDATHVRGRVSAVGIATLPDVTVTAYRLAGEDWIRVTRASTASDGTYDLARLAEGTYRLGFEDDEGRVLPEFYDDAARVEDGVDVTIGRGQVVDGLDAILARAGHITGTVTPKPGVLDGPHHATLYCSRPAGGWIGCQSDTTDDDGDYEFDGLAAGTYRVGFEDYAGEFLPEFWKDADDLAGATDVVLGAGVSVAGIDGVLSARPRMTGRVTDPLGHPVYDVQVASFFALAGGGWGQDGMSVYTRSDGTFDLAGRRPGRYRVCFGAPSPVLEGQCWRGVPSIEEARDIVVGSSDVTGLDAVLDYTRQVTSVTRPVVKGKAKVGRKLTVTPGEWRPGQVRLTYQWRADGAVIGKATGPTMRLTRAQKGAKITAVVTAGFSEYAPASITTRATKKVRR